MNRRSFLKRIGLLAAGISIGAKLMTDTCTANAVEANLRRPDNKVWRPNPAWVTAQYENVSFNLDPYPPRYNIVNGQYEQVYPFVEVLIATPEDFV